MGRTTTGFRELSQEEQEMLTEMCARNQPAEIDFVTRQGDRRLARTRFFAETEDSLLIDRPMDRSVALPLRPGESVVVYFLLEDSRYAFMASVIGRELFEFRARQRVPALRLSYPKQIYKAQRRDTYRLPVLHLPLSNIKGEITINDETMKIEGCIVNLSAGGACVVLPDHVAGPRFKEGDPLLIELDLPDALSSCLMPSRIVWLERELPEKRLRMGIAWTLDGEEERGSTVYDQIARFVLREQQRLLRREADMRRRV